MCEKIQDCPRSGESIPEYWEKIKIVSAESYFIFRNANLYKLEPVEIGERKIRWTSRGERVKKFEVAEDLERTDIEWY